MCAYGLYVRLTLDEYDRLRDLARIERRPLRDQAAVLLAKALDVERISARPTDLNHPTPPSCASVGVTMNEEAPS